MRSDLICRMAILSSSSPNDTGTEISDMALSRLEKRPAVYSPRLVRRPEIGRAHVCTPVTNAHLVCSLMLEKKNHRDHTNKNNQTEIRTKHKNNIHHHDN